MSARGIEWLTSLEGGSHLRAYQDHVGNWTIGVGHTGPEVYKGLEITQEQADAYLREDLKEAEDYVNSLEGADTLNQNQFEALVSMSFNVGRFGEGMREAVATHAKDDDPIWMAKYVNAGGKYSEGLANRRQKEIEWFKKKVEGQQVRCIVFCFSFPS